MVQSLVAAADGEHERLITRLRKDRLSGRGKLCVVETSALLGTGPRPCYAGHGSIPKGTPRYREKTLERMTDAAALVNLTLPDDGDTRDSHSRDPSDSQSCGHGDSQFSRDSQSSRDHTTGSASSDDTIMCVFCKKAKATKEFVSKLRPDGPSVPYCAKCQA